VKRQILERLGTGVLDENGEIDRARVGKIVFGDLELLAWLENLLHPRVAAAYLEWRDRLAEMPDAPAVTVTEVPLPAGPRGSFRPSTPRRGEAAPRRLHVREQRLSRRSGYVRG
jgi:hypothetical protein